MSDRMVVWLLDFESQDTTQTGRYWWSGQGDLIYDSKTYKGTTSDAGVLMELSAVSFTEDLPNRRATFRLAVTPLSIRQALGVDLGAVKVKIQWLYSDNLGSTWTRIPRSFIGRLSNVTITDGVMTGEIETYLGDIDRKNVIYWSDEDQQAKYPAIYKADLYQTKAATTGTPIVNAGTKIRLSQNADKFYYMEGILIPSTGGMVEWTWQITSQSSRQPFFRYSGGATPETWPSDFLQYTDRTKSASAIILKAPISTTAYTAVWVQGRTPDLAFRQSREIASTDLREISWPPFD